MKSSPFALALPLVAVHMGLLLVFALAHRLAWALTLLGAAFLGIVVFSISSRLPFPMLS